ncbi:hypothetical protein ACGFIR_14800 [Micromonospora sp. NPDC049051]|uniref:hypothetical protein n=1 Tax=Micromonospora sp. NPDC049051 TaxID=3364264 RepID=UPI00371E5133
MYVVYAIDAAYAMLDTVLYLSKFGALPNAAPRLEAGAVRDEAAVAVSDGRRRAHH